jgi:hypothetical protein
MDKLEIQISGKIQSSNFPIWKKSLLDLIGSIKLELTTDDDFAAATDDAKLLKRAEKVIQEAKIKAIEQTEEIQLLFNGLDEISEQARSARLTLERQIRTKKQEIKDWLITASITEVREYIDSKPAIYSQLRNANYLERHHYETATKGKASILGVRKTLASLVRELMGAIDEECKQVLHNYDLIQTISLSDRLLFQDVNYLVTLPENELRLTIDNRIVKLSEQRARLKAANAENELNGIEDEAIFGKNNEKTGRYVISIELLSTRQSAINKAREIKGLFDGIDILVDMKLTLKLDSQA